MQALEATPINNQYNCILNKNIYKTLTYNQENLIELY